MENFRRTITFVLTPKVKRINKPKVKIEKVMPFEYFFHFEISKNLTAQRIHNSFLLILIHMCA